MNKIVFGFLLIVSVLSSMCNLKETERKNLSKKDFIDIISLKGNEIDGKILSIFMFCKVADKDIGLIDTWGLIKNFNTKKDLTFQDYVYSIFYDNQNINKSDDMYYCFQLDDEITLDYQNNVLDNFLNKYTIKDNVYRYYIYKNLSYNEKMTILYHLFQNGYFSYFDDISGYYFIQKITIEEKEDWIE